ncbi:MAG TPA: hypothetical protein VJJ47_02820 [Candidatus Paceibacterota bacterium]
MKPHTHQFAFNIDKTLKDKAVRKARAEGIPFSAVLNFAAKAFVKGDLEIGLVAEPDINEKTKRKLRAALRDIKKGKDLSPKFSSAEEAFAYLES